MTEKAVREEKDAIVGIVPAAAVTGINIPSDLKFEITDCKLYVLVVTLQEKYEKKLYTDLKTGIESNFEWPMFRTQVVNQSATNNLNFLIDSTLNNINRLFVICLGFS